MENQNKDMMALSLEFERAVRFLTDHMPVSDENSRKPILLHNIRVGMYLYERGYSKEVVVAGILHDTIEFAGVLPEKLRENFGEEITRLVHANTKDDSIEDKEEKTRELIRRCVENGESALIVKAADILDSFKWYSAMGNHDQIEYCQRNARRIFEFLPDDFRDPIFGELRMWNEGESQLKFR